MAGNLIDDAATLVRVVLFKLLLRVEEFGPPFVNCSDVVFVLNAALILSVESDLGVTFFPFVVLKNESY